MILNSATLTAFLEKMKKKIVNKTMFYCPNCGKEEATSNSSGEITCENCGFDETTDKPKNY